MQNCSKMQRNPFWRESFGTTPTFCSAFSSTIFCYPVHKLVDVPLYPYLVDEALIFISENHFDFQVEAVSPMPPTKRPMKIQLSLPRPGFRLANGAGCWLDGAPAAAISSLRPFSNSGPCAPLNKRGGALSEYAARHRARCDTPVMDLPPNISRTRRRPLVSGPPPPAVTRRDQNVQTLDGGEACQPSSCRKSIGRPPPSVGNLGDQGGGSLPNISQSRKAQQNDFNTLE